MLPSGPGFARASPPSGSSHVEALRVGCDVIPGCPVRYPNSTPEWGRLKTAILRFIRPLSDKNVFT